MRRVVLLLTAMAAVLVVASGVALAATITCSGGECLEGPPVGYGRRQGRPSQR